MAEDKPLAHRPELQGLQHLERAGLNVNTADEAINFAADELKAWTRIYELCLELRNFEITQLVQRNNFFMIFQGVLFAGVCQSGGQIPIVSFVVCAVGLVVSLLQAGMACGAKYWQAHWEVNTRHAELELVNMLKAHGKLSNKIAESELSVDPVVQSRLKRREWLIHLFKEEYNKDEIRRSLGTHRFKRKLINKMIMRQYSASRIPIYVGLFLAFFWFVLLVCTLRFDALDFKVLDVIVGFQAKKPV
ncbi:hypothetical protein K8374_08820 [Pseudomonas sp. p1(2021b)]|uniref:RipA family octameric membrane protein n=1 Tax=Pseudomonas sp. p1(2021b) TaxID=2874628 RepID=UPI001CCA8D90|nr:hypothetical protein [Pseudomonas sp. p1(2021b)]UBM27046.1 hypothetical protein K8374_08820 [Pseudomonas sp. p1(2021b)]